MADEVLKEIKYQGHKVVTEVARRDALGRTIDETYATKNELNDNQQRISELESTTYIYDGTVDEFIDDFFTANNINNGNYISKNNKVSALIRNSQNHGEFLKYNYYLSQGSHTIIYEDGETQETFNVEEDGNYDVYFRPEGNASWGGSKVYITKSNSSNLIRARSVLSNYNLRGTFNNWEALQMYETETQAIYWGIFLRNGDEFKIEHDGNYYPEENNYVINSTSYFDIYFNKDDNAIGIDNPAFAPFYIDKIALGFRAYVNLGIAMIYNIDGITKIYADAGDNRHIEKINDFVFNDDGLIHKDNLTTAIQTSLDKADTAVQPGTLNNYSLLIDAAHTLELTINHDNYVMSAVLKNKNGETLSSQSIDLPLETMIISASYDNDAKSIVLTLQSGSTITVPIGDLVDGLVSQTDFDGLESEVNLIDERLTAVETTIADTRIGITSQYVSQPSNVKVGSTIYINAKLRDSVNLYAVDSGQYNSSSSGSSLVANVDENGIITLSGTTSSSYETINLSLKQVFEANTTYTYHAEVENPSSVIIELRFRVSHNSEERVDLKRSNDYETTHTNIGDISILQIAANPNTNYNGVIISNIQVQKGSVATPYEPFGAHSKGKVMQYASKNILNLPSCTEVSISSVNGSQTSSNTYKRASASTSLKVNMVGSQVYAKYVKGHKYALLIHSTDNDFSEFTSASASLLRSDGSFIVNNVDEYWVTGTPNVYAIIVTWTAETQIGRLQPYFIGGSSLSITVDMRAVIDITSAGYEVVSNLTQYVDGWSQQLETLASGGSISENMYRSPLIKVFDENLYLTKPSGYTLTIYQFKENPKSLNANVDIDDYELIRAGEYSSSGKITLTLETNSIVYFLYASSPTLLSTWQATSQLEYGSVATEHSDYTAPIEIGTFDKSTDGNEKTFSFVVLGTENQNIGFIPQEDFISIDFADNVNDLTSSTFAYQSTNLATQIDKIEYRRNMYPKKWKSKLLCLQAKSVVTNYGEIALNFLNIGGQADGYHNAPYGRIDKSKAQSLANQDLDFTMVFAAGYQHKTHHGIRKMGDKWGFSVNGDYAPKTFTLNSATKPSITLPELARKVLKLIQPNCDIDSNIELTNMPTWWKFPYVDNSTYRNPYFSPSNPKRDGDYPYRAYKINFGSQSLFDLSYLVKKYNDAGDFEHGRVLNNYFNAYCKKIFQRRYTRFQTKKTTTGNALHIAYPLIRLEIGFVHNFNVMVNVHGSQPNEYKPLYPNGFGSTDNDILRYNKKWTGKLQKLYVELFMKFDNSNLDATMTTNNQADCCYVWWNIHCRK